MSHVARYNYTRIVENAAGYHLGPVELHLMIINSRGRRTVKRDSPIVFESVLERRKHPDVFVCNESAFGCKLQFLLNKQTKVQFVSRRSSLTSFRFDIQQEPAEILFHWRDVLSSLRSQMKGSWK